MKSFLMTALLIFAGHAAVAADLTCSSWGSRESYRIRDNQIETYVQGQLRHVTSCTADAVIMFPKHGPVCFDSALNIGFNVNRSAAFPVISVLEMRLENGRYLINRRLNFLTCN